jgi:hypothetical protein
VSFTASALLVSWAAIALLGFALAGVLARLHLLETTLTGPAVVPTPVGGPLPLPGVGRGPVLALFVDDGCRSCDQAVDGVAELEDRGLATIYWRAESPEAFAALEVTATPFAVVADADLRVVATLPVGSAARLAEAMATLAAVDPSDRASTGGPA